MLEELSGERMLYADDLALVSETLKGVKGRLYTLEHWSQKG